MRKNNLPFVASLLLVAFAAGSACGATTIISDTCTTVNTNSGFALGEGVNSGINPPNNTRMTGTVVANLRYYQTVTTRTSDHYDINSNRMRVTTQNTIGRYTLSANGSTPFDFSTALGALYATPATPATYDIKIGLRNDATSTARLSFSLATADGDVNSVDFGLQLYRATAGQDYYTVGKLIDTASSGVSDLKAAILTMAAGTGGTMINFLIRVTDAGFESGADYHSRVQVSIDNGSTWIYDTLTDGDLPNGFRFDATGRYIVFDQAGNTSGNVFYDTFSISSTYAPPPPPERIWTGGNADNNWWSSADNWNGLVPVSGDPLVFNGTTRQMNTNDLSGLTALSLTFSNGGFTLYGNPFTNTIGITNLAGTNVLAADLAWDSTGLKNWAVASGSELVLNNTNEVEVNGDHNLYGGGTLRLKGAMNIGVATSANPPFVVNEGVHIIDGGSLITRGGYRIGSMAAAPAGAQTILTNGAVLTITATSGNIRVGDSANPVTSRLVVDHSTLTSAGARLCIPYAAGATGELTQVGGTVSGARVSFSDSGAGTGTYSIKDGTLETYNIAEGTSGALSYMYFDNAVLRALALSTNAFMSGLNRAEIQAGGLTIDAQADVVIAQKLLGAGALTKTGSYAVTLTGANTYAGNTLVNAGKLALPTGQTYSKTIQVANSAELGVLVTTPGTTLTNGTLILGSGSGISTFSFDLATFGNPTAPLLSVTNLTANGIVNINVANGIQLSTGQFVLVHYEGSIGGLGFGAFVLANLPPGVEASLVNNTGNKSIDLNITAAPGYLWTGAVSSDWDTSTQNWINQATGLPSTYSDGIAAEFRDGADTGTVNLIMYPNPSAIIVSNNTLPYVLSGGAITTPLLRKNGPGAVTRAGGEADLITGIELNSGSYAVNNIYDATYTTVLSEAGAATGTFIKQGASTLTVNSTNSSFDGAVIIQEGTLKVGTDRALGATTGGTTIADGATLDVNNFSPGFEPVTVSGAGVGGQGAIIDSTTGGSVDANLRDVTLAGDTTFGAPNGGRWDLRVRSSTGAGPGLRGNGHNLTKVGPGLVSIACQRNLGVDTPYWHLNLGDILVSDGTLAFAESLELGNPSASLTVSAGAILQLYDLGLTNPIARTITMTDARLNISGTAADTNVVYGGFQLTGQNVFWCDQAHLIVNGPIAGSSGIRFFATDPGTLILNGVNTYTGDTIVTNGTLGGSGVIAGNLVMLGGTNSPGMSIGTLTVNGNVTLAGTTLMELDRSQSPNSDRLVAGGTLAFAGTLRVVLGPGAPAPQGGDVYQLFNKGSGSTFSAVSLPSLTGGMTWDTSKLGVNGTISVIGTTAPTTIGSVSVSSGTFGFSGTGGTEGSSYHVVSSPNVAAPLASWVPVASSVFGPGGTFSFSTNVVSSGPKAFFRVVTP
jgi:autotransporter-associated beta strand protein